MMKKWTKSDLRFFKNEGSKRSKKNEGVNWNQNQGENLYKMLKRCQMIDFGKMLNQLEV